MNAIFDQDLNILKQRQVDLEAFSHYLAFPLTEKWQKLNQVLTRQGIDLSAYHHYLQAHFSDVETNDSLLSKPPYSHIFQIGSQLLSNEKLTLQEINLVLQKLPPTSPGPEKFLRELLLQHKITIEEFYSLFTKKENLFTTTNSPYSIRLQNGIPEFYLRQTTQTQILGGYHLFEELGRGGMGVVYKAYHPGLNRTVAIKVLLAGEHASEKKIKRFLREIQTMAKLEHPGIVQILGSGEENGKQYLVMEYVDGNTLENRLPEERSIRESVLIVEKLLEALHYAHTQGVIHRDIKLSNIFCNTAQDCKIGDFGLARDIFEESDQKLTQTGVILGTSYYLAPEQIEGISQKIDSRCDVYAMGVCLYRLLTKKFPFLSEKQSELFQKILEGPPLPPSKQNKKIHQDLDKIVLKALEKSPERRYRTAKEFATDLKRFLNGYPIRAKSISYQEKWKNWKGRHRQKWGGILLCCISGLGFFFFFKISHHIERPQALQKYFQQAIHLKAKADSETQKNFASRSQKLHYLLSALTLLNEAFFLDPEQSEVLFEKRKVITSLVTLACEIRHYDLAEYLIQTLENKNAENSSFLTQFRSQITEHREHQLKQHLARLRFLKKYFFEKQATEALQQEALFEIVKMNEAEIFQKLLQNLEEGTLYFLSKDARSIQRNAYYNLVVSALGRLENRKAIAPIWSSLEKITESVVVLSVPNQQKKISEIRFMIVLANALGNLNADNKFLELHQITIKMPYVGLFNKETKRSYHKLAKLAKANYQEHSASDNEQDYIQKGLIKMQSNDFKEAILDYTKAIQLNPQSLLAYLHRGLCKKNLRDFAGAIEDYTKILEMDSHNASAYNNRGLARKLSNKLDLALNDFTQAIQYDPENSLYWSNRGLVLAEKKEYQKALESFTHAIQLNPLDADLYLERGNIYFNLNQWNSALENYNQSITIDPNHDSAYLNRGVIKKTQGDLDGALQDYDKAISINRKNPTPYSNRARVKELKGDIKGAIIDFTEVLRVLPSDTMSLYYRGKLKYQLKDISEAKADFQLFIEQTKQEQQSRFLNAKQDIFSLFPEFAR
ncbi:MAG: tetratricopeptide repeat protein [Planctomycetota bacterium]